MRLLLTAVLMGIVCNAYSQNSDANIQDKDVRYLSKKGVTFFVLDLSDDKNIKVVQRKQTAFPLEFILPNTLVIADEFTEVQFLDIADEKSKQVISLNGQSLASLTGSTEYINSKDNGKRFFIKTTELSKFIEDGNIEQQFKKWSPKLITGATISTPFKFRPRIGDKNYIFTPEFTLGPFMGINLRMDKKLPIFLNGVVSAGINAININDNVQEQKDEKDGLALGFYGSIGAVIQVNDFQIGALYGYDFVSGEMGKNWIYNEKPWFSFSIGFNFLSSINKAEVKAKKQTKEINDQILLKDFMTDKTTASLTIATGPNGEKIYTKTYVDAENTVNSVPRESSEASDKAIGKNTEILNAAKIIQSVEKRSLQGKWVYFGQLENGKYVGEFGAHSLPTLGQKFTANSPVYKRDRFPKKLENGNWEKGNIIGAVEKDEEIHILDVEKTSDGLYVWVRVE